ENEFRPNDFLTREEAAKIIGQAYKILGYSQEVKNQNCNFVDIDKVNPELSGYVKDVCKRGIFKGSSGQFMPKKTITRPEAMAVLIRMFEGKTSYEAGRFRWSDYYLKGQALGLTMLNNINSYEKEIPRMEIALYIYRFKNIVTNETLRIMGLNKLSQISGDNNQINTGILSSFATIASSISVDNNPELKEAISWMNDNGLTNFNNIQDYKPFELLTREQASKVLDTFSNVFNLNVNSNDALPKECIFSDINDVDASLLNFVENICKAGVLQGTNGKFNPKGTINKSQFIVAIIRLFEGKKLDESAAPRWKNYFQKAQEMGIVSPADAITFENPITRYEVALFLYRFKVKYQMLTNLNTNKVQNEIVSTVPGSIQTGLSNLQEANVYIDTNLINNGNFELGYIEILGSRYKVVRSSTEKYFSNNFVWYGDVFNMETEDQTGTVSFIISNGYLVEGTVRISENNYIIQSLPNTNAYYKIKRTK
ncbi:MAG: S-layer homology domain-containing protein, partial [Candidatus Absconditabacterales bacterium]